MQSTCKKFAQRNLGHEVVTKVSPNKQDIVREVMEQEKFKVAYVSIQVIGSVAEWLALVTLVHVPQRTGGSRFEPWFGLGSYRWILGEFS